MAGDDDDGNGGQTWGPMVTTFVVAFAQGFICWLLFEKWRSRKEYTHVYYPRVAERPNRTPVEPGPKKLSWAKAAREVEDSETLRCVGMDTYVFLRFLSMCFKLCSLGVVLGCFILIPVYVSAQDFGSTASFNELTAANVPQGGDELWASVICYYIFILYFLSLIWKEWANFMPKRLAFLAAGDVDTDPIYKLTASVESIPEDMRSEGKLLEYFETEFPGDVVAAKMNINAEDLEKLCNERQEVIVKLENAQATKQFKPDKEPMAHVGKPLCLGTKKEAIGHWQSELDRLNEECTKEYDRILLLPKSESAADSGYIAFRSQEAKMRVLVAQNESSLKVLIMQAAEPDDVIWSNAAVSLKMSNAKRAGMNAFWTVGMLLWAIPVTFVTAIANLEKTFGISYPPPLSDPPLYGLITGLLPVVFLQILLMLVPIVIDISARKVIRVKSNTAVMEYVFKWHFGYQVANLWLILLGGSLMTQLPDMISDPTSIPKLIAAAVPEQSQFFIQMVITSTFGGLLMALSQAVKVIVFLIMTKIFKEASKSERTLEASRESMFWKWGWIYPAFIFNLMISLFYLPITPLILFFTWCNFGIASVAFKYQSLYVYRQRTEGGGQLMYPLYSFIWGILYMSEVVFIAYLGTKEGKVQAPVSFGLVILTAIAHFMVNKKFKTPSQNPKLVLKALQDSPEGKEEIGEAESPDLKPYTQESLVRDEWETQPRPYRTVMSSKGAVNQAEI